MEGNITVSIEVERKIDIEGKKGRNPEDIYKAYLEALQNKKN